MNKAMMVPAMMAIMLQIDPPPPSGVASQVQRYDASSLEHIMYGASPMPEALLGPLPLPPPRAAGAMGFKAVKYWSREERAHSQAVL